MMQKQDFDNKYLYAHGHTYFEDRFDDPKECFKIIGAKIKAGFKEGDSLLDVGTATGEFPYYLKKVLPELKLTGVDIDPKLIDIAKKRVEGGSFSVGDAANLENIEDASFDFVTQLAVLSVFDDFRPSIKEVVRVCKDKGTCIIFTAFNEYDLDLMIRYRYAGEDETKWQSGWNCFAKKSINSFLDSFERVDSYEYEKFRMPFDIAKKDDLIRSWTELDKDGERIQTNGIGRKIDTQILILHLK